MGIMVGVKLRRTQKGRQFALPLSICPMVLALALAWLLRDRVMEAIWLRSIVAPAQREEAARASTLASATACSPADLVKSVFRREIVLGAEWEAGAGQL